MNSLAAAALERAKALLIEPSPEQVRYAALELRMVMEMLTYEKLAAASDQLPPDVVNTWQPPQAIKALLEFQELADQSFSVSIAELPEDASPTSREAFENLNWLPLGDHHALKLAWLRKNYNKVGNILHAQAPSDSRILDFSKMAEDLRAITMELERAAFSTILAVAEKGGLVFSCICCDRPVVRNLAALERGETATCPTPGCDAEYRLVRNVEEGDEPTVTPIVASLECTACNEVIELHHRKVKVGSQFACPRCGAKHVIAGLQQRWQYAAVPEGPRPSAKST